MPKKEKTNQDEQRTPVVQKTTIEEFEKLKGRLFDLTTNNYDNAEGHHSQLDDWVSATVCSYVGYFSKTILGLLRGDTGFHSPYGALCYVHRLRKRLLEALPSTAPHYEEFCRVVDKLTDMAGDAYIRGISSGLFRAMSISDVPKLPFGLGEVPRPVL